jgi:hypothetical protein
MLGNSWVAAASQEGLNAMELDSYGAVVGKVEF